MKGYYVRSIPFEGPAWYLGAHGLGVIHGEPEHLDRCVVFFKDAALFETRDAALAAAQAHGFDPSRFQILPGTGRKTEYQDQAT